MPPILLFSLSDSVFLHVFSYMFFSFLLNTACFLTVQTFAAIQKVEGSVINNVQNLQFFDKSGAGFNVQRHCPGNISLFFMKTFEVWREIGDLLQRIRY